MESDTIQQVLAMFPKVETFHLGIVCASIKGYQFDPVELPALKCITMSSGSVIRTLKHFMGARSLIEVLFIDGVVQNDYTDLLSYCNDNFMSTPREKCADMLVQFLKHQVTLKKLSSLGVLVPYMFSADQNYQFRLNSLLIKIHEEYVSHWLKFPGFNITLSILLICRWVTS